MENIKIIIQSILELLQPLFNKITWACSFVCDYMNTAFEAFKHSAFYNSEFVQTNAFNFITVFLLLVFICKYAKIGQKLTSAQEKIKETIETSEKTKEDSIKELLDADEKVKNINQEVADIEKNNDENIERLKEKIEKDTLSQLEIIKENTKKLINTENQQSVSALTKQTALAAIELAKKHIKEVINNKPEYHQKFIEESIQELESGLK